MADVSELSTSDFGGDSDTTATVTSADSAFLTPRTDRNDRNDDDTKSQSIEPVEHHKPRHRRRKSGGRHKLRSRDRTASPSASPSVGHGAASKGNVAMRKILDAAPKMIKLSEDDDGHLHHEAVQRVLSEVYFEGNWNRGQYEVDELVGDEKAEEEQKEQTRSLGYAPLRVFDDDDMFVLSPSQRRASRPDKGHFAPYQYRRSAFPVPSQRLKRILYPLKKWKVEEEANPDIKAKLERLLSDEQVWFQCLSFNGCCPSMAVCDWLFVVRIIMLCFVRRRATSWSSIRR